MKNLFLFLFATLLLSNEAYSQIGIETQIGGANYLGVTLNTRINIALDESNSNRLCPSFGIGILAPGWDQPTSIINVGLTYNYKNWGIGTEVSGFANNPFLTSSRPRDFPDMIVYPNLNYTCTFSSNLYLRFSAGPYFAFTKKTEPFSEVTKLRFEGDVIPGAGITFGYIFR